jgi:hypothetical protein
MTGKAARWIGAILLALSTGITGFWMTGSLAQRQAPPGNTRRQCQPGTSAGTKWSVFAGTGAQAFSTRRQPFDNRTGGQ